MADILNDEYRGYQKESDIAFFVEWLGEEWTFIEAYYSGAYSQHAWYFVIDPIMPPFGPFETSKEAYEAGKNYILENMKS